MLETLANAAGELPPNQHFITITIPRGTTFEVVTKDRLPGWDTLHPDVSREFGAQWAMRARSAILLVPNYPNLSRIDGRI
jgi:RES domain-containing protein